MSEFNKLIGQKVIAEIVHDEDDVEFIEGIVTNIQVDDYYFYEKNEPIYIKVSINPTGDLGEDFDYESLYEIPLNMIRKA